jgi:hypothetical protein
MAVTYHCDNCEVTATSLNSWYFVVVGHFHVDGGLPAGMDKMLDATNPDLVFHSIECRNAWCAKTGVEPPVVPS